jgi:hypothetical protein
MSKETASFLHALWPQLVKDSDKLLVAAYPYFNPRGMQHAVKGQCTCGPGYSSPGIGCMTSNSPKRHLIKTEAALDLPQSCWL